MKINPRELVGKVEYVSINGLYLGHGQIHSTCTLNQSDWVDLITEMENQRHKSEIPGLGVVPHASVNIIIYLSVGSDVRVIYPEDYSGHVN